MIEGDGTHFLFAGIGILAADYCQKIEGQKNVLNIQYCGEGGEKPMTSFKGEMLDIINKLFLKIILKIGNAILAV
jgi:hypothetical protein